MPAPREMVDEAQRRGYLNESPRERQVREHLEGEQEAVKASARQRYGEAKCSLSGHRWDTHNTPWECLRCGALYHPLPHERPGG